MGKKNYEFYGHRKTVIIIIIYGIITALGIFGTYSSIIQSVDKLGMELVAKYAADEEKELNTFKTILSLGNTYMDKLVKMELSDDEILNGARAYFEKANESEGRIDFGYKVIYKGKVISNRNDVGNDYITSEWYRIGCEAKGQTVFTSIYDYDKGICSNIIVVTVNSDNEYALCIDLDLLNLERTHNEWEFVDKEQYFLADENGRLLYYTGEKMQDGDAAYEDYLRIREGRKHGKHIVLHDRNGTLRYAYSFKNNLGLSGTITIPVSVIFDRYIFVIIIYGIFYLGLLYMIISNILKEKKHFLSKKNDERVINAMTTMYSQSLIIDLVHSKITVLNTDNDISELVDENTDLNSHFEKFNRKYVADDQFDDMMKFTDMNTIRQRLSREQYVSYEYKSKLRGWSRLIMIAMERDKNDDVTMVLFVIQKIDMERVGELEKLYFAASQASEAKTEFLSKMSHDIRTPMNVVLGMTQIAKKYVNNPSMIEDCLNKIEKSGGHLQILINDILDISAIENRKLVITPRETDIIQLLTNIDNVMNGLVANKSLEYNMDISGLSVKYLILDPLRFNQICINLLSNSVKYTEPGGRVDFKIWNEDTGRDDTVFLCTRISDTGMGMSREFMKKMFDEFAREIDTRVNTAQGTGLGLAIVKQLVDLMAGTIDVDSELGRGTCFDIRLEVAVANKDMIESDSVPVYENLCRGMRILVAEDNDMNYEMERELFSFYGIETERAVNGADAVDIIFSKEKDYYDAVLMDIQMPVMNGIEATKEIRKRETDTDNRIPIIAMTANAFFGDIDMCMESGMDAHVAKPFKMEILLDKLSKYTRGR